MMHDTLQRRVDALYAEVPEFPAERFARFRFGRGGVLAAVIVAHLMALYVVMHLSSMITRVVNEPMQVVMLTEVHQERPIPPPPPAATFPTMQIAVIEPVIDVHTESVPLTIVSRVEEVSAVNTGSTTPKEISSVEYIRKPLAKYPAAARALKQHGIVILRAMIDASGRATEVNVYRSSGYGLLDDAAREAALNALYKPYTENGRALPVYVRIPVEF